MNAVQTEGKQAKKPAPATKKLLYILIPVLLILVPTMMEYGILLPRSRYILFLFCIMCVYAVANSGLDVLFGYTGQMSLGHAGFYAIGAYVSVLLSHGSYGISQWIGFKLPPIVSMFIAAFVAMLFGILLAKPATKLVYHFLTLLTIAFGQLVFLAISSFPNITNTYLGITGIPPVSLFGFKFNSNYKFYLFGLGMVALMLLVKRHIINSRVGRAFIAIRENQLAANGCGVNVPYYKTVAFAISAFYTGMAGAMYAHLIGFISPESFMYAQSVIFMTMLVFGGTGNLLGPVLGAMVITVVQQALQSTQNYQNLIYGVFLLVVILFLPKGIWGLFGNVKNLLRKVGNKQNAHT